MKVELSIIICTHNREDLLRECLNSFVAQTATPSCFEVIIVNNASTDHTAAVATEFEATYPHFRMVTEEKVGLSYARNLGFQAAKASWVSYVDDDAKAAPNYVKRALETISTHSFDCFGGVFLPWFKYGKPRWLSPNFGSNRAMITDRKVRPLVKLNACGGVIVFRKEALERVGGFAVHLGMNGTQLAYGEEDLVQEEMRSLGYQIGFDSELKIEHLVAKYKLDWRWHIHSAYAHGAAEVEVYQIKIRYPRLFLLFGAIIFPLLKTPYLLGRVLVQQRYYWQNALIDSLGPAAHYKGRYDRFQIQRKMGKKSETQVQLSLDEKI